MKLLYKIKENDNVGTAMEHLDKGTHNVWLEGYGIVENVCVSSEVPKWFKVALTDVRKNQEVVKFGYPIGVATVDIKRGNVVHRGNIVFEVNHDWVMLDPVTIEHKFEIGKTKRPVWKGEKIKAGRWSARAVTNIPAKAPLYCGNLCEPEHLKIGPKQLAAMKRRYAALIKRMTKTRKIKDVDFMIFATEFHDLIVFYRMLQYGLGLHEISRGKGR